MTYALYAEIYLICLVIVGLLLFWAYRKGTDSTSERWLRRVLTAFTGNFACNLCFTLVIAAPKLRFVTTPAAYFFKTCYHISLCVGVYTWCGYMEAQRDQRRHGSRFRRMLTLIPLAVPIVVAIANLWTHHLFEITGDGRYIRHFMFQFEMAYLSAASVAFCVPLLLKRFRENDLIHQVNLKLAATFPLCILLAWALTFLGESVPVICVCVTIELLCLYMETSTRQISMDKLTQVNNRQNLLSFLDYKLHNHEESLFLMMMDVDYFKSINDTFGHLEGDDALVLVSRILKEACSHHERRPYISRYGGDEFIILLEGTRAEADAICARIHERLAEICAEQSKPYRLTLSIGMARWQPDMDVKRFIEAADEALYEIKRARDAAAAH